MVGIGLYETAPIQDAILTGYGGLILNHSCIGITLNAFVRRSAGEFE